MDVIVKRKWWQPRWYEVLVVLTVMLAVIAWLVIRGNIPSPTTWFVTDAAKHEEAAAEHAESSANSAAASKQAASVAAGFRNEAARSAASGERSAQAAVASASGARTSEVNAGQFATRAEKAAAAASSTLAAVQKADRQQARPQPETKAAKPKGPPAEKQAERKASNARTAEATPRVQQQSAATSPESFSSLQPFQRFARGAGEGMAYEYKPRTKAEFVSLLRNKDLAKREMRVPCEVIVRQMAEGHKALPLEGCEGTAALIERDSRFVVVACNDEMFLRKKLLTVTNESGSGFGVWHRKCLPNEQVLSYEGDPLISLLCLNVAVPVQPVRDPPVAAAPPPSAAPPPPAAAPPKPSTYALQINCMSDRADGHWRSSYEAAKARREQNLMRDDISKKGMLPYYEVFTQAPFGNMLAERKSRPQDCTFVVRFLKKEPVLDIRPGDSSSVRTTKYNEYLRHWQQPPAENVVSAQRVSTGSRGWVIVPITVPLEQFEAVLVQPENIGDVLEPVVAVHRPEFADQSNPIHVWEVRQ